MSKSADPQLFKEEYLTFFAGYQSPKSRVQIIMVGEKLPVSMNRNEMFRTNTERIEWGKKTGRLFRDSKGVSKLTIDDVPTLLMDVVSQQGERLQTYTFFHSAYPNNSFAINIMGERVEYEKYSRSIETFINTVKLDFGVKPISKLSAKEQDSNEVREQQKTQISKTAVLPPQTKPSKDAPNIANKPIITETMRKLLETISDVSILQKGSKNGKTMAWLALVQNLTNISLVTDKIRSEDVVPQTVDILMKFINDRSTSNDQEDLLSCGNAALALGEFGKSARKAIPVLEILKGCNIDWVSLQAEKAIEKIINA